ncbi:MAG: cytochrome c oxidase assembly protein, partial [Actinomycetia bacterium]|nr:cytochrome c oxidase assembly protein [Actinomycetes bacterium]
MLLLALPYLIATRRRNQAEGSSPESRRKVRFFLAGMAFLWVATDWPLGLLGASYLAWAHMLQYLLYT